MVGEEKERKRGVLRRGDVIGLASSVNGKEKADSDDLNEDLNWFVQSSGRKKVGLKRRGKGEWVDYKARRNRQAGS